MGQTKQKELPRNFRVTARGRVRAQAPASSPLHGLMSAHLHDVLQMCASGMGWDQLRQFLPPRTLRETLEALFDQQLLEGVSQDTRELLAA